MKMKKDCVRLLALRAFKLPQMSEKVFDAFAKLMVKKLMVR